MILKKLLTAVLHRRRSGLWQAGEPMQKLARGCVAV
jgi:hypothetical protein